MESSDSAGPRKIHHVALKAVGSAFGLIIAPIIVVLGANLLQKKIDEPGADATKSAAVAKDKEDKPDPAPAKAPEAEAKHKGIRKGLAKAHPAKKQGPSTVRLFSGRDLSGFYTYFGATEEAGEAVGKKQESGTVRAISARNGELHISGRRQGALITDDAYENYHLTLEFKWGEHTFYKTPTHLRQSGIVLHANGTDGEVRGRWMPGVQVEIVERHTGNFFIPLRPAKRVNMMVEIAEKTHGQGKGLRTAFIYKPGAPRTPVSSGLVLRADTTPFQLPEDALKTPDAFEKPRGEWNTLECICDHDSIVVLLNGKRVNAATKVNPSKGKIIFLSEWAEIFFRNIELTQL